ncbi:MAG: hypothetical protein WCW13_03775 [archaeon]|jgi:hypothetical protein
MDFKVDFGPWETVFAGETYGHEVEIVSNPEHFFLVIIYDKRDGKKVGAVIEGYKAYSAHGQMESFIQTLPKPSFGIEKTLGAKTIKLFFLSFDPFYLDFKQDDFIRKVDVEIRKTEENASVIVDLARTSSLDLKDLSSVSKNDYAPVLGDPFTLKALISGQKPTDLAKIDVGSNVNDYEENAPIIQIGLSKTRGIIKERVENFKRTTIIGETNAINYAMYILAENILLENTPVIIFDSNDYFLGLGTATTDSVSLKDEMVDFEPIAFPVRQVAAKDTIKISLKNTDLSFVFDLIGLKDEEFQKNVSLFAFTTQVNTPEELIGRLLETKEISDYAKLRAERLLKIINNQFGGLFGEEIPATELAKVIAGNLGRAVIIDTKTLSAEEKIILMHTLIRQLTKSSSSQTQISNCMVLMPESQLLINQNLEKATTLISRLENRGVGVIMGLEKEAPEELAATMSAKINIVAGKDLAVSIKGKRNYRVQLRPSLSGSPKI